MKNDPHRQALLVPYADRENVRALGAQWDKHDRVWTIEAGTAVPRQYLPLRDRPGLKPPYIRINLIPQTSWGMNLRAMMPKPEWKAFIKEHVYSSTGSRCLVCGERGPEWPVEADEIWKFDDNKRIQTLVGIVPLCPDCHSVRTCGFARAQGRENEVVKHLAWVERIGRKSAQFTINQAIMRWEQRSRKKWTIDISFMERHYGIPIQWNEEAAREANISLRREDARRTRKNKGQKR